MYATPKVTDPLIMRILHTSAFYHPRRGGAEEVVRELSERLAARGHDITVATTSLAERSDQEYNGVKIREFDISSRLNHSVLGISGDVDSYLRFLRTGKFDLVLNYAAQTWCTDLTCRILSELEAKTVLAACGYSGLLGLRRLLYWRYFRQLPRFLKQYDAVVYHADGYIDKQFGDAHAIRHFRIIPNGVDGTLFRSPAVDFRKFYGIDTKYMLLSVGNHFRNKGHDRVISAFRRMRRSDTTLVIVGGNIAPGYRSCWNRCQRNAGNGVVLVEGAPRSHVTAAFFAADAFLSGSYIEAFPLVIIESMASGTPYVSFPAGNICQLAGGYVVNSVAEMAAAVECLLEDACLRERLGAEGRAEQAARFEWDAVVDQYEDLYRTLVNSCYDSALAR